MKNKITDPKKNIINGVQYVFCNKEKAWHVKGQPARPVKGTFPAVRCICG
jgi:hypothetical protein